MNMKARLEAVKFFSIFGEKMRKKWSKLFTAMNFGNSCDKLWKMEKYLRFSVNVFERAAN